jgi:hypothetical protein
MPSPRRWFRYKLRTMLIVAAMGPPIFAGVIQYVRWRDDRLWQSLETAKRERDELLTAWRRTRDLVSTGQASAAQEAVIEARYYAARQDAQTADKAIRGRYGSTDYDLLRAMQARRVRK